MWYNILKGCDEEASGQNVKESARSVRAHDRNPVRYPFRADGANPPLAVVEPSVFAALRLWGHCAPLSAPDLGECEWYRGNYPPHGFLPWGGLFMLKSDQE